MWLLQVLNRTFYNPVDINFCIRDTSSRGSRNNDVKFWVRLHEVILENNLSPPFFSFVLLNLFKTGIWYTGLYHCHTDLWRNGVAKVTVFTWNRSELFSKYVDPARLTSELLWDLRPKGSLKFFALSWWAGSSVSGGNVCVGPTDTHVYTYRITMYSCVLFLQTGAPSPLQSKEPRHTRACTPARAHT